MLGEAFLPFNLFSVWIFALAISSLDLQAQDQVKWVAFGDIRGNLETCGCDPKTDMGGMDRLITFVSRERAFHSDLNNP